MFELNDETRWILGRPGFTLARLAETLRLLGHDIARRAEDEQAACIYFFLCQYEKHGGEWREVTDKYLTDEVEKLKARRGRDTPTPSCVGDSGSRSVGNPYDLFVSLLKEAAGLAKDRATGIHMTTTREEAKELNQRIVRALRAAGVELD